MAVGSFGFGSLPPTTGYLTSWLTSKVSCLIAIKIKKAARKRSEYARPFSLQRQPQSKDNCVAVKGVSIKPEKTVEGF